MKKNANDIFFGIELKVLSFSEKNANDIFFSMFFLYQGVKWTFI